MKSNFSLILLSIILLSFCDVNAQIKTFAENIVVSQVEKVVFGNHTEDRRTIHLYTIDHLTSITDKIALNHQKLEFTTDPVLILRIRRELDSLNVERKRFAQEFSRKLEKSYQIISENSDLKYVQKLFSQGKYAELIKIVEKRMPLITIKLDSAEFYKQLNLQEKSALNKSIEQYSQELILYAKSLEMEHLTEDWADRTLEAFCMAVKSHPTEVNIRMLSDFCEYGDQNKKGEQFFRELFSSGVPTQLIPSVLMAIANICYYQEKYDKSEEGYRSTLFTIESICKRSASQELLQADALSRQGNFFRWDDDEEAAMDYYKKSRELATSHIAVDSTWSLEIQLNAAEGVAAILREKKNINSALLAEYDVINLVDSLSTQHPALYIPMVANIQMRIAKLYMAKKDTVSAVENVRGAIDIYSFGFSIDSNSVNSFFLPQLAHAYKYLSYCFDDNSLDSAIRYRQMSIDLYEKTEPEENSDLRNILGRLYNNIAISYARNGQFDLAKKNYDLCIADIENNKDAKIYANHIEAGIYENQINMLRSAKQHQLAIQKTEKLISVLKQLSKPEEYQEWLARLQRYMGWEYFQLGESKKAIANYKLALNTYLAVPNRDKKTYINKSIKDIELNITNIKHPRTNPFVMLDVQHDFWLSQD